MLYEHHGDITSAIVRQKRIKDWPRKWKVQLIEADNPNWADLFPSPPTLVITGSPGQAGR